MAGKKGGGRARSGGGGGGGGGARRKPQSGKAKKEHLKAKREQKRKRAQEMEQQEEQERQAQYESFHTNDADTKGQGSQGNTNDTPVFVRAGKDNKLTSFFLRESNQAVMERKFRSQKPLDLSKRSKEPWFEPGVDLGMPKRPAWDANTSADALNDMEEKVFKEWLESIAGTHADPLADVSPFENNLEVWRQLWRTLERSQVVLLTADVRNPLLHIPQALLHYAREDLNLPVVICLTKCDLVSDEYVNRWLQRLKLRYTNVTFLPFTNRVERTDGVGALSRKGVAARRRILMKKPSKADVEAVYVSTDKIIQACLSVARKAFGKNELVTAGIVGQPNTGKSTLVNALMGEKVVSVSRQCGHTKHWQTHIIERNGEPIMQICDSPGLIFPISVQHGLGSTARHMFETNGLYPIPQIREPFSAVRLIAEWVPLETLYNLKLDEDDYGPEWTPYSIIGSFADQKGYTIEGGGPDFHRAGLEIIRDTVDGYVLFAFQPPPAHDAVPISSPPPTQPEHQQKEI